MRQQDKYIALDWLKPEIDHACDAIIDNLAKLDSKDELLLIAQNIHQISGTLKLTELNDFLILSETLEEFCNHLAKKDIEFFESRELLQGVAVLQFELDKLHRSKRQQTGALTQRANHLRKLMGKESLGSTHEHAINFSLILPKGVSISEQLSQENLSTLNTAWRQHTLELLNQAQKASFSASTSDLKGSTNGLLASKNNTALDGLVKIAGYLSQGTKEIPKAALWHVARAWLSSLKLNTVPSQSYTHLLTRLNSHITTSQDTQTCELLITDIFIHLAGFKTKNDDAVALYQQFSPQLGEHKTTRILDSVQGAVEAAQRDFENSPQQAIKKLKEAKWLLEVGGWHIYEQYIEHIISELRNLYLGVEQTSIAESHINIKRQLHELHSAIVNTKQLIDSGKVGLDKDASYGAVTDAKDAVLRETRLSIEKIKNHFNAYCLSKDFANLGGIPELLTQAQGAFAMLELNRSATLIEELKALFEKILNANIEVLSWGEIDAIADSISAIEYYFDLLAQHYHDDKVLDSAQSHIALAHEKLDANIANPIIKQDIIHQDAMLKTSNKSSDMVRYDDTGTLSELSDLKSDASTLATTLITGNDSQPAQDKTLKTSASLKTEENNSQVSKSSLVIPDTSATAASSTQAANIHSVQAVDGNPFDDEDGMLDIIDLDDFDDINDDLVASAQTLETKTLENTTTNEQGVDHLHHEQLGSSMMLIANLNNSYNLKKSQEVTKAELLLNDDDYTQDEEIRDIFIEEADEVVSHIGHYLPLWQAQKEDMSSLTEVRRGFHTLKGSGRMVGAVKIGEVAWAVENLLNRVIDNQVKADDELIQFVTQVIEIMPILVDDFAKQKPMSYNPVVPIVQANNLIASKPINQGLIEQHDEVLDEPVDIKAANNKTADSSEHVQETEAVSDAPITQDFSDDTSFDFDEFDNLENYDEFDGFEFKSESPDDTQPPALDTQETTLDTQEATVSTSEESKLDAPETTADLAAAQSDSVEQTQTQSGSESTISAALQEWMDLVDEPKPDDLTADEEIKEIFIEEADEVLELISQKLPIWQSDLADNTLLSDIRRGFHTLKGSGRMVGAYKVGELAWSVEDMLNRVIDKSIEADQDIVLIIKTAVDVIPSMMSNFEHGNPDNAVVLPLMGVAKSFSHKDGLDPEPARQLALESIGSIDTAATKEKQPETLDTTSSSGSSPVQDDSAVASTPDDADLSTLKNLSVDSEQVEYLGANDIDPITADMPVDNTVNDKIAQAADTAASTAMDLANNETDKNPVTDSTTSAINFDLPDMTISELAHGANEVEASLAGKHTTNNEDDAKDESLSIFDEIDDFDGGFLDDDNTKAENLTETASADYAANAGYVDELGSTEKLDDAFDFDDDINVENYDSAVSAKPESQDDNKIEHFETKSLAQINGANSDSDIQSSNSISNTSDSDLFDFELDDGDVGFDNFDNHPTTDAPAQNQEQAFADGTHEVSIDAQVKPNDVASSNSADAVINTNSADTPPSSLAGSNAQVVGGADHNANAPAQPTDEVGTDTGEDKFKDVFLEESEQLLQQIDTFAEENDEGGEISDELVRALHTLRGSAAMSGELDVLRDLNMSMEQACRHLLANQKNLNIEHVGLLRELYGRSKLHIDSYRHGHPATKTTQDKDLIQRIDQIADTHASSSDKIMVAELIELNIDNVLDAEWELENHLLADYDTAYVDTMKTQLGKLHDHTLNVPKLNDVVNYLRHFYSALTQDHTLGKQDRFIDALLVGHRQITRMFDAIAASQRIEQDPAVVSQLAETKSWLDDSHTPATQKVQQANEAEQKAQANGGMDAADNMTVTPGDGIDVLGDVSQSLLDDIELDDDILPVIHSNNVAEDELFNFDETSSENAVFVDDDTADKEDLSAVSTAQDSVVDEKMALPSSPSVSAISKNTPVENDAQNLLKQKATPQLQKQTTTTYEYAEDEELLPIFLEEAIELNEQIEHSFSQWQQNPSDLDALATLQRYLHTIKGGARMAQFSSIGDITHEAETIYEMLAAERFEPSSILMRFMRHVQDILAEQIDELEQHGRTFHATNELNVIQHYTQKQDDALLYEFFDESAPSAAEPVSEHDDKTTRSAEDTTAADDDKASLETADNTPADTSLTTSSDDDVEHSESAGVYTDTSANVSSDTKQAADTPLSLDIGSVTAAFSAAVATEPWTEENQPDDEMLEIFLEEAEEIVENSSSLVHEWLNDANNTDLLAGLQRELHTLKGGARMAGVQTLGDLAHEMEFAYEDLAQGRAKPSAQIGKVLAQAHDWLAESVQALKANENPQTPLLIIEALKRFDENPETFNLADFKTGITHTELPQVPLDETDTDSKTQAEVIEDVAPSENASPSKETKVSEEVTTSSDESETSLETPPAASTSQGAVFTKADLQAELAEAQDQQSKKVETLAETSAPSLVAQAALPSQTEETDSPAGKQVDMPDMRGNFKQQDSKQSLTTEQIRISALLMEKLINLSGEGAINRGRIEVSNNSLAGTIEEMGATVQRLADQLRRMDGELESQILSQYEGEIAEQADFDPLEMDQYSALNQLSKSLSESASDLLDIKTTMLDKARETDGLLLQLSRIQSELQEGLMDSRLIPFSRLSPRLQRITRQTANELGKQVELTIVNADSEVDRTILDRITSPLEHMLRNGIDHGVETPDERKANGKDPKGKVTLELAREGGEIVISISDDGKGIDVDAVRKKAQSKGLIANLDDLSDKDIMQYIFNAGLSTASKVTQISGRGVGMDVVQSEIKQLGGVVSVDSVKGEGSTFTMRLPLTVAVADALIVRSADRFYAIPLVQIDRVERVSFEAIKQYYSSSDTEITINNNTYRLRYLNNMIHGTQFTELNQTGASVPVIIVKTPSGTKQAVHVDELSGSRQEIVVKPLGSQLAKIQGISAATILGDGSVMLILDLLALIRTSPVEKQIIKVTKAHEKDDSKTHVLVVDDSVTVRKVTTRLLDRNDFDSSTAKDGVDAIEKLQELTPDVILLDIEMPRMDGFEVAMQVRKDKRLAHVPIIMITSRTGEKHRERAFELGVNCYMGKPFQEKELLENITAVLEQQDIHVE